MKINLEDTYITVCSRRGSGKTTLVMWLVRTYKHLFKEVFVISPSSFSGAWDDVVPKENVYQEWKEDWADKLITKMGSVNRGKNKDTPGFTRVLIILDDLLSSDAKAHHKQSHENLRGARAPSGSLSVERRSQFEKHLTHDEDVERSFDYREAEFRDILFEEFGGPNGMDKKEFDSFVRRNTDNYQFLVVCNTASNTSDDNQVFSVIRAPSTD